MEWVISFLDVVNAHSIIFKLLLFFLALVMMYVVFKSMAKKQEAKMITIQCPVLHKMETIGVGVNIFRDPEKIGKGLDVETCTEFLDGTGQVTCGKLCLFDPAAQALHQEALSAHREVLKKDSLIIP